MYTNAQILAAVLVKWAEPMMTQLGVEKLMNVPVMCALQNKIRSTGWVSQQWSIAREMSPLIGRISNRVFAPMIENFVSKYPDKDLPNLAHSIVDEAIKDGQLTILDGNVAFDESDLRTLKRLLNANMPYCENEAYTVVTDDMCNE